MSYQVFARKWRPQKFEEMVGQKPVAQTLLNAIQSNRLAHAYIFSGSRGVGKTTMARLLAKAVNCESGPTIDPCGQCVLCREIAEGISVDVLEIDGASNRGIDNIRELKDQIKYAPLKGKYKIYIIDEVHMLTSEAFNALLKTLEEPPSHTIFILATTELHKIPSTILSRCQQFQFKKIGRLEMMEQLWRIIHEEKINIPEKALLIIAKAANGSMRDALSMLDQVVSYSGVIVADEDVRSILGVMDMKIVYELTEAISRKEISRLLKLFRNLIDSGVDLKYFCQEWINHLRNLMMMQLIPDSKSFLDLPEDELLDLSKLTQLFSLDQLQRFFKIFTQAEEDIRFSSHPVFVMEIALIKTASVEALEPLENLIARVNRLAEQIEGASTHSLLVDKQQDSLPLQQTSSILVDQGKDQNFQQLWAQLMKSLKEKKPNLESYLKQSLWITQENDLIRIGYSVKSPFISFIKKEENLKFLIAECNEIFKRNISIEILSADENDPRTVTGQTMVQPESVSLSFVQKVQEILGGKIIEIKE